MSPLRAARAVCLPFLFLAGITLPPTVRGEVAAERLDPRLLTAANRSELHRFMVVLREQADVSGAAALATKREKTRYVFEALRATAARTQPAVRAELERRGFVVTAFTISNQLMAEAPAGESVRSASLSALAARSDVARVEPVGEAFLPTTRIERDPVAMPNGAGLTWTRNVAAVGARALYETGVRGRGIVVGIADTGAAAHHPALWRNYRGRLAGDDYNWFDPTLEHSPAPIDTNGHGTHTTGIAVGTTPSRQIGVAPRATWISCRALGPGASAATVLGCLDWFLAPTDREGRNPDPDRAPDVTNNSFICPFCGLETAFRNLSAAGIFAVAAPGNFGPTCGSVFSPGDYPSTTAVGATTGDRASDLAEFSSRGPLPSGAVRPSLVAPGQNITSAAPPNGYVTMSGTSMAAPHLTGAVALLWSARPELVGRVSATRSVLYASAFPRFDELQECSPADARPNNLFGYGFIDTYKAVTGVRLP